SSSEVYGTAESDPMDEEHPLNPRSPYAATKAGADRLAYSYFVTYGLPIVILRPFNNYGPRQHWEKVVPRFVTSALSDEPLTVHGDGHASRDWLYVEDAAEAIVAAIEADLDAAAGDPDRRGAGFRFAARRAIGPVEDEPAIDRLASAERIDGVVAPGIDFPVAIAARVASRLGITHPLDPQTAQLATSKLRRRERF